MEDRRNEHHPPRFDRRHDANFQRYVTVFALVLNLAGIVWGAARLSASVDQLAEIVKPLALQVQQNSRDIEVLKDRSTRGNDAGR